MSLKTAMPSSVYFVWKIDGRKKKENFRCHVDENAMPLSAGIYLRSSILELSVLPTNPSPSIWLQFINKLNGNEKEKKKYEKQREARTTSDKKSTKQHGNGLRRNK